MRVELSVDPECDIESVDECQAGMRCSTLDVSACTALEGLVHNTVQLVNFTCKF